MSRNNEISNNGLLMLIHKNNKKMIETFFSVYEVVVNLDIF